MHPRIVRPLTLLAALCLLAPVALAGQECVPAPDRGEVTLAQLALGAARELERPAIFPGDTVRALACLHAAVRVAGLHPGAFLELVGRNAVLARVAMDRFPTELAASPAVVLLVGRHWAEQATRRQDGPVSARRARRARLEGDLALDYMRLWLDFDRTASGYFLFSQIVADLPGDPCPYCPRAADAPSYGRDLALPALVRAAEMGHPVARSVLADRFAHGVFPFERRPDAARALYRELGDTVRLAAVTCPGRLAPEELWRCRATGTVALGSHEGNRIASGLVGSPRAADWESDALPLRYDDLPALIRDLDAAIARGYRPGGARLLAHLYGNPNFGTSAERDRGWLWFERAVALGEAEEDAPPFWLAWDRALHAHDPGRDETRAPRHIAGPYPLNLPFRTFLDASEPPRP